MEKSLVHIILLIIGMELQTFLTFQLHGEMALHCSVRYQFYKHDRTIFQCRRKIQIAYLPNSATLTKAGTFPCLKAGLGFYDGG